MSNTPPDNAAITEQKRADAGVGTQPDAAYIDALLVEREGYAIHGRADRMAEVDEQLALRGYADAGEARSVAKPKTARGRGSKPQQTT